LDKKRNAVPDAWSSHPCSAVSFLFGDRFPQSLFVRTPLYLGIWIKKETSCTLPTLIVEVLHEQVILNTAQYII